MVPRVLLAAGLVATAVGAALLIVFPWYQSSFGWFAYAPLSNDAYTPWKLLSGTAIAALIILVAAIPLLSFGAVLWVTRRWPLIQQGRRSGT